VITFEELAKSAHAAFEKEMSRRMGVRARGFDELPFPEPACWVAATKQVMAEAGIASLPMPDMGEVSQSVIKTEGMPVWPKF
jgi:hypothetical protein